MFHGIVPALLLTLKPQGIYRDSHPIPRFPWDFFVAFLTLYSQRLHSGCSFTPFHPFLPPITSPLRSVCFSYRLLFPLDFIVFLQLQGSFPSNSFPFPHTFVHFHKLLLFFSPSDAAFLLLGLS